MGRTTPCGCSRSLIITSKVARGRTGRITACLHRIPLSLRNFRTTNAGNSPLGSSMSSVVVRDRLVRIRIIERKLRTFKVAIGLLVIIVDAAQCPVAIQRGFPRQTPLTRAQVSKYLTEFDFITQTLADCYSYL